jgi:ketopantoate reductase
MTSSAPGTPAAEQTLTGSERAQVLAFVHDNRTEVAALLDGLTEEQARARLVPSATTLLGIVKHCAFVEKVWFHVSLAGRSRGEVGIPEAAEDSWLLVPGDTVESVRAAYLAAWAEAEEIAAPYDLDDLAVHNRRGPLTLRWVYVHLVEELARHAGHGDILREQVLAAG